MIASSILFKSSLQSALRYKACALAYDLSSSSDKASIASVSNSSFFGGDVTRIRLKKFSCHVYSMNETISIYFRGVSTHLFLRHGSMLLTPRGLLDTLLLTLPLELYKHHSGLYHKCEI